MEPIADSEIKRVLVINAHPDDSDFGASGTIAQWVKQGIEVSYVLCTNGDQGGEESGFTNEEMPEVRQREQRAACAGNPFAFTDLLEEGLQPWKVKEVWMQGHAHPDHFVDITDTFHFKLAALKEHASQTSHMDNLEEMLREWGQRNAGLGELPEGRIAEAFKIVNTN